MIFGILDRERNKIISWYNADRITLKIPYASLVDFLHFEVGEDKYPDGYFINAEGALEYDFSYVPPAPSYSKAKEAELISIQEGFEIMGIQFAVENSQILNDEITRMAVAGEINPTDPAAVSAFIRGKLDPLVDALAPIFQDIKMCYFWRIKERMALVPREPLLASEERLTDYENQLLAITNP